MTNIKTKDLVVIFIIAKLLSLVAAIFIVGTKGNVGTTELLAHALSLTLFFGFLLLITKRSPSNLLRDTKVKGQKWGHAAAWILLCIPLGFMVRFGVEGVYLVIANAYDHRLAVSDFNDLITNDGRGGGQVMWLFIAVAAVGALDEEFIYRRILLWHFSSSYGLIAGILVTSLIFGAIHLNPVTALAAVCLACVYLASGRLWVVVAAHAAGNMFHPIMHPLISMMNWGTYFAASIAASIIICVIMARIILQIKRKARLYFDLKSILGTGSGPISPKGTE